MKNKFTIKARPGLHIIFLFLMMFKSGLMFADGSRDLYPAGKNGHRAVLRSSTTVEEYYPFPNFGTHYVYAKAGEKLALASSAQGLGSARIRMYAPNGSEVVNNTSGGKINNRTEELAGPKLSASDNTVNRYTPIYYTVTVTGIYRIEFISPSVSGNNHETVQTADGTWSQKNNNRGIVAWEVAVINSAENGFIKGRVYMNVLNLSMGNNDTSSSVGFHGVVYALTKDGYTYRINNNGSNGIFFTYFVNNNGFIDSNGAPLYKSLNTSAPGNQVKNPNDADTSKSITHKMFYTLPANDLPTNSTGAVPGNSTWLKNAVVTPQVTDLKLVGVETSPGHVSNKGGYIQFNSGAQGQYTIIIESTSLPAQFVTRTMTGITSNGANSILWDGKDGAGNALPNGTFPATIKVQLNGAEVHFPFIDMEYNTKGIIIELLNHTNLANVVSDIVYWNDTDIPNATTGSNSNPKNNSHLPPQNSTGISSNINGHIWGVGGIGSAGQFGDKKSIDTWKFIAGEATTHTFQVDVRVADLKITEVSADKNSVIPNDQLTYTVKVANAGPRDVIGAPFTFKIPAGFTHQSVVFSGKNCGTEATVINFNSTTNTYSSALTLPNGCEITYVFKVLVNNLPTTGIKQAEATILRTNDFTDPDATNPNPAIPPTDPHYECANNGLSVPCNNIRQHLIYYSKTEICTENVEGKAFSAKNGQSTTFNQPATDFGFQFDIYTLDNSFNMNINGTPLATMEIDFQHDHTTLPDLKTIRFADGSQYGDGTVPEIYNMTGVAGAPLVRVLISPTGAVSMYGSKSSGGALEPLELFNGNYFNIISWNTNAANTVIATQRVDGETYITGYGSGKKIVPCACYNPPITTGNGPDSKVGITLLRRAGSQNADHWPMIRKSAHLVLESNTKGFVITRIAKNDLVNITQPQEGMMVYDTTEQCLKIYSDGDWKCFKNKACP